MRTFSVPHRVGIVEFVGYTRLPGVQMRRIATEICNHESDRGTRGIWGLPVVGKGAWLTTGEAAERLAVSDETVRRWVIAGDTFRVGETMTTRGGHRRIAATAVDRLLREAQERSATSEDPDGP